MTSLNYDIKDKLKRLTIFEKIIAVNFGIFLIGWLLSVILSQGRAESLIWLALPRDFTDFIVKPWSILSYGFTHLNFWHLFFNMLVLYFIGRSMSNLFSVKLSLNIYLLGILFGGLSFILIYTIFPDGFLKTVGPLVGASAGVRAVLIFLCAYMPNKEFRLIAFNVKLLYLGIAIVVLDVIGLFSLNPGGNVAHLGGALLGCFYAIQLKKGTDIGKGFERIIDAVSGLFSFGKKSHLKTVHKRKKTKKFAGHTKQEFGEFNKQKQIDVILDKISKSGYESLSKEEKEFLFKAGKK